MKHTQTAKKVRFILRADAVPALRCAVGAVAMLGAEKAQPLLELPDAELGRLIKNGVVQFLPLTAQFLSASPQRKKQPKPTTRSCAAASENAGIDQDAFVKQAIPERQKLVRAGKLLTARETWEGLHITRQALSKVVQAGRIFFVEMGTTQFYPAFYLAEDIDRKTLGKVTKCLGDLPGWSKWQFFTTPKASLENITPLQALARGLVEQVESAASAFAER